MKAHITKDYFINHANQIHGNKYNYDKIKTLEGVTKVEIICPEHGLFLQSKYDHLNGCGCPICGLKKNKRTKKKKNKVLYGVGINDYDGFINNKGVVMKSYLTWRDMIRRCYGIYDEDKNAIYKKKDCKVCDEWLYFSNFKKWFDNPDNGYIDGYHLDKDILVKGNNIYSHDTCCFVPQEVNKLFTKHDSKRGLLPIGVSKSGSGYIVNINGSKFRKYIGYFKDVESAFNAYKKEKEAYIKEIAYKYFNDGKITKKVYDALMNYQVDVND